MTKPALTLSELISQLTRLKADNPALADKPVAIRRTFAKGRGTNTQFHALTWAYARHGTKVGGVHYCEISMAQESIDGKTYA